MTNRGSRRNTGNYVVTSDICTTLPKDLTKVDIVNDWSIKIQSKMEGIEHHSSETSSENPTTLQEAKDRVYHMCGNIHWEGSFYRKDIGHRAL